MSKNKFETVVSGSIEKINGLVDVTVDLMIDNDYGYSEIFTDIDYFLKDNIDINEGQRLFFIATVTGFFETYNTWEGPESDIELELVDIITKDVSYLINKKTVLIDLDDTLIQTQKLYDTVKSDTIDLIIDETKTTKTKEELLKMFSVLHVKNSKKVKDEFGLMLSLSFKEKFRLSFEELYIELVGSENISNDFVEKLNESAMNVFYYTSEMYEGAEYFLKKLREFDFNICLITNGDRDVQQRRIATNNLKGYFDQIIIANGSKGEHMEGYLEKINKEHIIMIGNSFKSDIEPALLLDIPAIHINQGNWVFDTHEVDESLKEKDLYYQAKDYNEILEVLKQRGWIATY